MVWHCVYRTCLVLGRENTFVATCDLAIADYVESIGGRAVMTSKNHVRATSRTLEADEVFEAVTYGYVPKSRSNKAPCAPSNNIVSFLFENSFNIFHVG